MSCGEIRSVPCSHGEKEITMAEVEATPEPATPAPAPRAAPAKPSKGGGFVEALREAIKPSKKERQAQIRAEAEEKGANTVLKGLGVKKSERARMLEQIKDGKFQLSAAEERAQAATAEAAAAKNAATSAAAEADALKPMVARLKKMADREFAALPEPLQKTLIAQKIDDPMQRLDQIEIWKETKVLEAFAGQAAAPAAPTVPPVVQPTADNKPVDGAPVIPQPKVPNPSNTLATGTPTPPKPSATLNHYEQWQEYKNSGQKMLAANFFKTHQAKILEQQPKA